MKIIIEGLRGEGKSYLAVILMKLLSGFPYGIKYTNQTKLQEKDKLEHYESIKKIDNNKLTKAMELKLRELEIIDIDDNEEIF